MTEPHIQTSMIITGKEYTEMQAEIARLKAEVERLRAALEKAESNFYNMARSPSGTRTKAAKGDADANRQ
jgi:hypothetical protein